MSNVTDDAVSPELIDKALERVLASRGFRGSARNRRFLQFIVQQTRAGHANRIKAYTIAVDVFDRNADFDPLIDPVVRIQAGRIRNCLEQYYLNEGAADPIRITIPKGSYVPHFTLVPDAAQTASQDRDEDAPRATADAATNARRSEPVLPAFFRRRAFIALAAVLLGAAILLLLFWVTPFALRSGAGEPGRAEPSADSNLAAIVRGPSLLVLPFVNGTGDPSRDILAEGFTEDLIGALIRFRNLLVFGADTSFRYGTAIGLRDADPPINPDYVLKGSVSQAGEQIQITVALIQAKDRRYLWSNTIRRDITPSIPFDLRRDIAAQVARALAQPHGVIHTEEARSSAERPPTALSSYECLLRTRQYWRRLTPVLHAQVRTCLQRAVQADPLYADAWAALALVVIDEARLGFNPSSDRPDPLADGLRLATHAAALAPDAPLPLQALGLAHWLRREPQLGIAVYERALALNPNDSDILADLGRCYSLIGEWDRGIPLIEEAYVRNPAQPSWYRIVLALHHYMNGRYDEALAEAERVDVPQSVMPHVALAMIHGQAGHKPEAAAEVREILRIDPEFAGKVVAELERRNIEPATIQRILDGLQKAGLPIQPRF